MPVKNVEYKTFLQALAELEEERALNKLLLSDQEKWSIRLAEMEAKNTSLHEKYVAVSITSNYQG